MGWVGKAKKGLKKAINLNFGGLLKSKRGGKLAQTELTLGGINPNMVIF
jgi:hypothetical protein